MNNFKLKKIHQLSHNENLPLHTSNPGIHSSVEGAPSHVSLHVKCEVVRPGECPLAQVALEGPVSGVLAVMTREFVRACELPPAAFPAAVVGLLTCEHKEGKGLLHRAKERRLLDAYSCVIAHDGSIVRALKLTGVRAEMCLQVGAFGIGFSAAGEAADVRGCALPRPCASSPFRLGLEELQRRRGRREHHPLSAWLQAQTFVVHAKSRMRGVVRHLHLGSLRMVRERCGCVVLLRKVHGLAQVGLAL